MREMEEGKGAYAPKRLTKCVSSGCVIAIAFHGRSGGGDGDLRLH